MKKLLVLAISLATGVSFAQNSSTATQNGYGNDANVTQTGYTNSSNVDQDGKIYGIGNGGDENSATVLQVGISNQSMIKQHGDYNTGSVDQDGWYNSASQDVGVGYAEFNQASAYQRGGMNTSMQIQRFDNNEASVTQIGAGFLGYGNNYAKQDQRSGANAVDGSDAVIFQFGYDNRAIQKQRGSGNVADSFQWGTNNYSKETQTSVAGGSFANMSYVTQFGDDHSAIVKQNSVGANNFSDILQTNLLGVGGNTATVTQDALTGGNNSYVEQHGANNATITQTGGFGI